MKLRSQNQLIDAIDTDLAWRKRELTTLKLTVGRMRSHEQAYWVRGAICLLYAHWEGFIKFSATAFLNYLSLRGLHCSQLAPHLLTVVARPRMKTVQGAKRAIILHEVTRFFLSDMGNLADIPWEDAVDTESNLGSEVMRDILFMLGIPSERYMARGPLIDQELRDYRNNIAHGRGVRLEMSDYERLHGLTLEMIEWFRDDIQDAVVRQTYLRTSAGAGGSHPG